LNLQPLALTGSVFEAAILRFLSAGGESAPGGGKAVLRLAASVDPDPIY